jgi:citrate lyase beta subunit
MTRSLLFVPGDSGRKFGHAAASDADALILDLEDSVAPDQKPAARAQVRAMLERGAPDKQLWVRINALDGGDALANGAYFTEYQSWSDADWAHARQMAKAASQPRQPAEEGTRA